jgi:hypothetical protein
MERLASDEDMARASTMSFDELAQDALAAKYEGRPRPE